MKAAKDRLKELAAGYWSATLSDEQERELRTLIASHPTPLDSELETLKVMLSGFEALSGEFEAVQAQKPLTLGAKILRLSAGLSAAALLAIGVFTLIDTQPSPEVYCYINGEPITDLEVAMEQTKYLSSLSSLSQSISLLESLKID